MWWPVKFGISCFLITVFHFLCHNRSFARMKAVCVNTGVHNLLWTMKSRGGELYGWFRELTLLCLCISSWTSLLVTAAPNVMSSRGIIQKQEARGEWVFCSCLSLSPPLLFPVRNALPRSTHTGLFPLKPYYSGVGHRHTCVLSARKDRKGATGIFSLHCGNGLDQEGRTRGGGLLIRPTWSPQALCLPLY